MPHLRRHGCGLGRQAGVKGQSSRCQQEIRAAKAPAGAMPRQEEPELDWSRVPEPISTAPAKKTVDTIPTCRHCGGFIRLRARHADGDAVCPTCGKIWDEDEPVKRDSSLPNLEIDDTDDDDEDNDDPYDLVGGSKIPFCPECKHELGRGDKLCVRCGYDLTKRRKHKKSYQEMHLHWVNGYTWQGRMKLLLAIQTFVLVWIIFMGWLLQLDTPGGLAITYLLFTGMMCFCIGTFDEIFVDRDTRGRVQITKIWYSFFFKLPPRTNKLIGYANITSGRVNEAGFWEWLLMFGLLPYCIIPGVVWWYLSIHRDTFFVVLARDHGAPALSIYRGFNQEVMTDIAESLSNLSGLGYDRS